MSFFSSITMVDLLLLSICARIIFIGIKKGLKIEFFKTLGMLVALVLSVHYYAAAGYVLSGWTGISRETAGTVAFVAIWLLVVFLFKLIRDGALLIFPKEFSPAVNRLGGAVSGGVRSVLVCAMTVLTLWMVPVGATRQQVNHAWAAETLITSGVKFYSLVFEQVISRVFTSEEINTQALSLAADVSNVPAGVRQ